MEGEINKNFVKICNDIKESNHVFQSVTHSNSNGDNQNISSLPWLLIEQKSKDVKGVIEKKISNSIFLKHKEYPNKER